MCRLNYLVFSLGVFHCFPSKLLNWRLVQLWLYLGVRLKNSLLLLSACSDDRRRVFLKIIFCIAVRQKSSHLRSSLVSIDCRCKLVRTNFCIQSNIAPEKAFSQISKTFSTSIYNSLNWNVPISQSAGIVNLGKWTSDEIFMLIPFNWQSGFWNENH